MSKITLYRRRAGIKKLFLEEHARHAEVMNSLNEQFAELNQKIYFDKAKSVTGKCFKVRAFKSKFAPYCYYKVQEIKDSEVICSFFYDSHVGIDNSIRDLFNDYVAITFDQLKYKGLVPRNIITLDEYNKAAKKWADSLRQKIS